MSISLFHKKERARVRDRDSIPMKCSHCYPPCYPPSDSTSPRSWVSIGDVNLEPSFVGQPDSVPLLLPAPLCSP